MILSRRVVEFDDALLGRLRRQGPQVRQWLTHTELAEIEYDSGGLRIRAYVARPRKSQQRLPLLILNRGGAGADSRWTDLGAARQVARAASWGYLVLASQYRGIAGSEGLEEIGGGDLDDVDRLVDVARELARDETSIDVDSIGLYGHSRGGMMTCMGLRRGFAGVRAAVLSAALTDLFDLRQRRPRVISEHFARCVPGFEQDPEQGMRRCSAVHWADELPANVPTLIIHGTADWRIDAGQSLRLASALVAARRPCRLVLLEGSDHFLTEHLDESWAMTRHWFDSYVRDHKALPDLEPHGI